MKRIAFLILLTTSSAFGQLARVDIPIQTSGPNVPSGAGPLPQALWVANSTVNVCVHPSASLAYCQAHPITTSTDGTGGTACPSNMQLVQLPGNTCTQYSGVQANVGFWYTGGAVDYWITSSYGSFGPFTFNPPSISSGSAVNINGSPVSNPNFNSSSPSPDGGYSAATFKVSGSNAIVEVSNIGNTCATSGLFNVACPAYGAKGDSVHLTGCSGTATQYLVTCTSANIPSNVGDGNHVIQLIGFGTGAQSPTLYSPVASYVSATQLNLTTPIATTVASGGTGVVGTLDEPAYNAALTAACNAPGLGKTVYIPPGFDSMLYPTAFYSINDQATYNLIVPCSNVSIASQSPGATLEMNGAAQVVVGLHDSGTCVRGKGIGINPNGNPVNDSIIWITMLGNTVGNTQNGSYATPGNGCTGWDISQQGVFIGGLASGFLMDHDTIHYMEGENVASDSDYDLTITNSDLGFTNADTLSIQAEQLLVQGNKLHDCYQNAAENPINSLVGVISRYYDNNIYNCSEGLNLISTNLGPSGTMIDVQRNTFQDIGVNGNINGYQAAVILSSQFTGGVQGGGTQTIKLNKFIDNYSNIDISGDSTPNGITGVTISDNDIVINALTETFGFLFGSGPYFDIMVDGNKIYSTPYAQAHGYKLQTPFAFAGGAYTNVVIKNNILNSDAIGYTSEWAQNHVGDWAQWTAQVPLWQGNVCTGTCPYTFIFTTNGLLQQITSVDPDLLPGLDQALVNVQGGTVAATVLGGKSLDGQEFLITVFNGTLTLTSDSNQTIAGGPITETVNGQAFFRYSGPSGKWIMIWHT